MEKSIHAKLDTLVQRHEELGALLSEQDIISDQDRFRKLSIEYAEIEPVVHQYQNYCQTQEDLSTAKSMLKDPDENIREMAQDEFQRIQGDVEIAEKEYHRLFTSL